MENEIGEIACINYKFLNYQNKVSRLIDKVMREDSITAMNRKMQYAPFVGNYSPLMSK